MVMSQRSFELHRQLSRYKELRDLDNPEVGSLLVHGFSAVDLSGISIQKTEVPSAVNGPDTIITIKEIVDNENATASSLSEYGIKNKLIRTTDYMRSFRGKFSKPEQRLNSLPESEPRDLNMLNALSRMTNLVLKTYLHLEDSKASDLEITNCEHLLASTYKELDNYLLEELDFVESINLYDATAHVSLVRKLGSLVLY